MKKLTAMLLACLLIVTALAGCAQNQAPSEPSQTPETKEDVPDTKPADEPAGEPALSGSITLMASQNWIKDIDHELFEKFEAETGVDVKVLLTPDNGYETLLGTTLAGGSDTVDMFMYSAGSPMLSAGIPEIALDLSGEAWVANMEDWMCSQRLRNLLYQRLVPGCGQLLCLEEDELRCSDEVLGIVKMRVNDQLRQSIEKNDEAQIRSELEMIFKYMSDRAIAQRDMQKIITYIIRLCELASGADADSGYKQIMRMLCCAYDAQLLPGQLVNAVMKIFWPGEGTGDLAAQLVEYIDRHFIQLEQLESITGVFHYNYAYLSRLFKKQTGVPINKYVLEKRLNLSMQLIENNEALNIAQIAALSGFSDRRYFLRAFKAYTNMSPSEYKNSIILKG